MDSSPFRGTKLSNYPQKTKTVFECVGMIRRVPEFQTIPAPAQKFNIRIISKVCVLFQVRGKFIGADAEQGHLPLQLGNSCAEEFGALPFAYSVTCVWSHKIT